LKDSARLVVYTPGSDAGIPVSILASLKAPEVPWEGHREMLREKISSTVTALLGLVGLKDIDPVRSREHILLSNIFEDAWSQGKDLSLDELIMQTQSPPFEKLGVFDVNTFFPEKDRFELAMLLNNIMASPAFQTWIEGQPLDIASLLYTPDKKPRHSVFYIAHLPESERMFFVTLLFSAIESWMRSQSGTTSLRALVYFDEIFGYLPPVANPASKEPMLRMLKQARAFGVGLVLVTQNPVDVDYKGISNTGTWFIGKLQTDQDKQRLLDGLEGATAGGLDRSTYDRMISKLGKRVFLLHNVHNKEPLLMQTRWAMSYLAGPLARNQIATVNALAGAGPVAEAPAAASAAVAQPAGARPSQPTMPTAQRTSATRPTVPGGASEYFLPNNQTLTEAIQSAGPGFEKVRGSQGMVYHPVLLAQARTFMLNRKYNLDFELVQSVLVADPDRRGAVRWENFPTPHVDPRRLEDRPAPDSVFSSLEMPLSDARMLASLEKDFADWAYRSGKAVVRANESLKVYCGPEVSQNDFRQMCAEAARRGRDVELKKSAESIDHKLDTLKEKMKREERELEQDESELSQRKMEELGTHAETIFGLFSGRKSSRRVSSSLTKRRLTSTAKADVKESKEVLADLEAQIAELEKERTQILEDVEKRWSEIASQVEEITVTPLKKDVNVELFGVAWLPYYQIMKGDQPGELPAYLAE
jgi:hypothetical protein